MQAENEVDQLTKKLAESVNRSAELLSANKHYQFTQKIMSLSQRKAQTHKLLEAETLLKLAIRKMYDQEQVEFNAVHDLVVNLITLYEKNRDLWKPEKAHELYQLLMEKPCAKNIDYFSRILKNLSSIDESPEITDFIINYFEKRELFYKAQSLIAHMDLSRAMIFLERWHEKVDNDEYAVVVCRMALLKGLYYDFDEPMVLLSDLDAHHPFVKFAKFLIQTVQMNSRQAYEKIGLSYQKFLASDPFFESLYQGYGAKFFKKQKAGSGLLGLFEK